MKLLYILNHMNRTNLTILHNRANLNLFRYATMVVVLLFAFGYSDAWASSDYARGFAKVSSSSPSGKGKVYVAYTSEGGTQPATPAASSSSWKTSEASAQAEGTKTTFDFYYYSLPTSGYALEGWSEVDGASDYSNNAVAKYSIKTSESSLNDAYTDVTLYAHFVPNPNVTVTFLTPDPKCTYTVQCDGAGVPVGSSKTTNKSFNLAITVNDANYKLLGWYTTTDGGSTKSYFSPNTTFTNKYFPQTCSVGVDLVEASKPVFMVGDKLFTDLNAANSAASSGSNKTIVLVSDGMLDVGNYTISSGNTLLIPHTIGSTFVNAKSVVNAPYIVKTASPLSAFRKLTLQDGVNITVNGTLCVAGKMMASGGGKASAYPTGEVGMIDMSNGGNITLNGTLFCWGFIKGQDMDQGNNTSGCGTITANNGATVWEGFATGDWRGGTASSTIYSNASSWKFFPFQSYTIQNIEVPVTYNYGSTLSNYMSISGDGQVYNGTFSLVGSTSGKVLFLLKDSGSKLKKWYNPQTDLVCYEMSGTTQLDALNVDAAGETVSSSDYNLPISTSMHLILASSTSISKPVEIQAGAVIEVKNSATVTCSSNVYIFDKDQWGEYCNSKYYYTMSNLTSHKDRGNGTSNEMIDDAKMIIDGTLNVTGKLYTTTSGADIMGNGGGKITFGSLDSSTKNIVMCTGVATNENVPINQACLHNEDDSYTKAIASTTFHNVNGRWFKAASKDEKANHTYDFTYIRSGAVSGTDGNNTTTPAVYSNDKSGLVACMKWANVTPDACDNWWQGQGAQATWFYNWTENSDWHQFIPTEIDNVYSASNNKLYEKSSCTWGEIGETDEDCLYTIAGVKKALVDGHFIALEANNNDPAFHLASDATKYYLCFGGCNWHEAIKYEGENKAYIVDGGNYIWYDEAWLNVQRQEPFFYTLDASNAQVCYEYVNGNWQIALPYVRVTCPTEPDRYLYFFNEALTVASAKKNATITILRDIPDVKTAGVFTGVNTTCTLDLNGHTVTGSINNLLTINASGSNFTITDNTAEKEGKLSMEFALNNTRYYTLYVQKGTVILENGTIEATNILPYNKSTAPKPLAGGVNVAAGTTFTMNGGNLIVTAPYNPIGINSAGSATVATTVNINTGSTIDVTATTIDSPYGFYGYATVNFNGGTMDVTATKSTKAYGFHVLAYYKSATNNYVGTLNLKGGTVTVKSQGGTAYGIQVNRALVYDTNEPRNITKQYLAKANISGGELNVITPTKTTAIGISTQGDVDFYGGTINVTPATTTAYGVRIYSGETKIRNTAQLNVTATGTAYGVRVAEEAPTTAGLVYRGTLTMSGGKITVNTTSSTNAYGVFVGGITLANSTTNASNSKSYAGNYASFGTANISGGEIDVSGKTTKVYDVFVKAAVAESGAEGYATAYSTPNCTITGGKYKLQSLTNATTEVAFTNDAATTTNYKISAGYYNDNVNLENYAASPKHVVTLTDADVNYPEYSYKVAEAYNVTFKNGDATLQSSYQENGKTPVYLGETPTKASTTTESYIFDGWSTSNGGSLISPLPNVTSAGATYYAHYNTTPLKYIVSLDAATNGGTCGTDKIYVEPGAAVGTLPEATKTGHTFNGWYTAATGGTKLESTATISADGTYYAQFKVNNYTLTWVLDGGKVSTAGKYGSTSWPAKNATGTPSKSIPYASTLTAPVVTKTGYTFSKWSPLVAGTMPAEATTYTAIWLPNSSTVYTVKHYQQNVDGTYPTTPFETESLTGTTATSVTPETKTYDGFISPATQTKTIAADGKMVVEYKYTRRHYTFTLDATTNGGISDVPSIEVIHGATIGTVPPDAQKGCNDFTGWFTKPVGGVKVTSSFIIEYDMKKLYAQFSDDVRTYPIIYNAGAHGAGSIAAGIKTCGENATLSGSTFTRTGYTQTGWSLTDGGEKTYDLGGTYTANAALTLYPFWTVNQYTISFDSKGGSVVGDITQDYNSSVSAPADPTKTGYTFSCWLPAIPGTMPAENMECVAQWTINQYTITFDSKGGSEVEEITQDYNSSVSAPAAPTKKGYTFAGWVPAVPATMPVDGATCVAQWTPNTNTPYVVKHYQQNLDGTYPSEPTDTDNETGTTDTEVTPTVKSYAGFTAPSTQTVTILPDGSRVVTYQYTRNSYTLTWNLDGGSVSVAGTPAGSVKYGAALTAPTVTKNGYTFNSWSPSAPAATMPAADATYTATWTVNSYIIRFLNYDGSVLQSSPVNFGETPVYSGSTPTKPADETYTYTFTGWSPTVTAVSEAQDYTAQFSQTQNVASVKVGSAVPSYYTDFADAWEAINSATGEVTLKLFKDVSGIATSLAYTNAQNCTLDLNNHTLSGTVTKLININAAGKTFTIDDSSDDKGGKISMITSANARVYCLFITAGTVNLKHGTIYSKNTHTYSSASANKNSAATAVYVTKSQKFIMDDGTVESEAQRASYAIFADKAGTTTITINGGLVKGHTNKSTTAAGIYTYAKGLTVNGGRIVGHAYTTTAYGIFLYGGNATLNGGTIEATNDTTNNAGTTTTYGVYVRYSSSTYKGVLTVPSTSTVSVLAKSRTTTACAVYVYASSTGSTIAGGTFTAKAKTSTTAQGINSAGNITVSGGTFNVSAATTTSTLTTWPCGIYATRGTVTVNDNPTFNVTSGTSRAFGVFAYGTIGAKGTGKYPGTIKINGGTFNVTTTTTTAYGAYAGLLGKNIIQKTENAGDTIFGQHYMQGIISITNGTFNVKATTNTAYGIAVAAANTESGAVGTTVRTPTATITGGKFKVTGTSKTYAVNTSAANTALVVEGGWYNIQTNLSSYVAPTKSCNYHVLPLEGESPYLYEVAEAYTLTWNLDGGAVTTAGTGAAVDATGTPNSVVKKGASLTAPTVTKPGYTFAAWTPAVAATMPAANTTYTATWTAVASLAFVNPGVWSDPANWKPACVPTAAHDVYIQKPCSVDIGHAAAKSIVLDQSDSHTGSLTIGANKGLEVVGTITRTTTGEDKLATRPEDLKLETSSTGNATLIFNNSNSNQATVGLYSKGFIDGSGTKNYQYIGVPCEEVSALYNFYGSWMYSWGTKKNGSLGWVSVKNGASVSEWTGYCITQQAPTTYAIEGTLVQTTSKDITVPANENMVVGNSWTAPIDINAMTPSDLEGLAANIYFFNTGVDKEGSDVAVGSRYAGGTYITVPVEAAKYTGEDDHINSMQGFFVKNTNPSAEGTLHLDYDKHVRGTTRGSIIGDELHAPKRAQADTDEPVVLKIKVSGENYDDKLLLLSHEDFTASFDNGWDGDKWDGNESALYLYTTDSEGTENSVSAVPELEGTVIGFRAGEDDGYTLHFDYLNSDEPLYLYDTQMRSYTRIKTGATYWFLTNDKEKHARFIITRTEGQEIATGLTPNDQREEVKAKKLLIEDKMFILVNGMLFDVTGKIVK